MLQSSSSGTSDGAQRHIAQSFTCMLKGYKPFPPLADAGIAQIDSVVPVLTLDVLSMFTGLACR